MTKLKAIQTKYDGYHFRSRLEARWAVFFNAAGIKYEYEKEGFKLPAGSYLPDFWLPELNLWLEVKGSEPMMDELNLCFELYMETKSGVMMTCGLPGENCHFSGGYPEHVNFPLFWGSRRDGNLLLGHSCYWTQCPITRKISFNMEEELIGRDTQTTFIEDAFIKAKSARFEHGETPE